MAASAVATTLEALLASSSTLKQTLHSLTSTGEAHATSCATVSARLSSALSDLKTKKEEGSSLRTTVSLVNEMESAKKMLEGGQEAIARAVPLLEASARRTFRFDAASDKSTNLFVLATAVQKERRPPVSSRASQCLDAVVAKATRAHEDDWRTWVAAAAGQTLFDGARALALADSSSSSSRGLEREKNSLDEAKARLACAARIDGLQAVCRASSERADDETKPAVSDLASAAARAAAASVESLVSRCLALFRTDQASRLTFELQKAGRVASAAGNADTATLLEAVAEAAATAARAARSIEAVLSLLGASGASDEDGGTSSSGGGGGAADAAEVEAVVLALAKGTDELLAQLRAVPPAAPAGDAAAAGGGGGRGGGGKRAPALKALGTATCALLKKQQDAAASLVRAAQTAKGRRALSTLGEAGESFAAAAASQARAELAGGE